MTATACRYTAIIYNSTGARRLGIRKAKDPTTLSTILFQCAAPLAVIWEGDEVFSTWTFR